MEAHSGAGSGGTYGPMNRGAHTGSGLLAGLVSTWRAEAGAMESPVIPEVLHPVGENHTGAVQDLQSVGMINIREIHEGETPTLV